MSPITIVLSEGFSDWEIAPLAGAGAAFYGAEISYASADGAVVTSIAGMRPASISKLGPVGTNVIVVCGGPAFESNAPPDIADVLRQAYETGAVVAGICGGTLALARAGLLDDVRHTSNAANYLTDNAPAYKGASRYADVPRAVRDGRIITAPAPAPASFAAEVLMAAGLAEKDAKGLRQMLAREHSQV